ncbi:hypothetical protein M3Y98_00873500 [Aphelenchoides besseyi]|nr:hypothetical protein M3Y98_00873500 [Aphelenchoides besseyi]
MQKSKRTSCYHSISIHRFPWSRNVVEKKEPKAQSPSASLSVSSRRKQRLKKTNTDKSIKQISSSKSTKSAKNPRSGHSQKTVKKETGLQAEAETPTKSSGQKNENQASIRRLIPSISPKMFSRRWSLLRGESGQHANDSNRSRKNAPNAANPSNRQSKIASVRQSSIKKPPHPQSKEANKDLQPTDKETSYVDRLLNRLSNSHPSAPVSAQPKERNNKQGDHSISSRKSKKMKSQNSLKANSKKSQKKSKVVESNVEKPNLSPSPSKAPSSTPKSQKAVQKAVNTKSPLAAGVKKSPVSSSPNTPLLPSVPVRRSRRYFYTKDEDPGSIGQSSETVAPVKAPIKDTPAPNTTPIPTPNSNVDKEEEEKSSDESESERSNKDGEVLEQERNVDQKPQKLQTVKVVVRPGEPVPINNEQADRIAKLRANAPKPKPQPKNAKEVKIHEKRIFKQKNDYPTMNDVVSDWDSVNEQKFQNEKKEKNPQPPEKTNNGQVWSSSLNKMRAFDFQILSISTFIVLAALLLFNELSLALISIYEGGNYSVVVNKSELIIHFENQRVDRSEDTEHVTMNVSGCVLKLVIKPTDDFPTTQIMSYNEKVPVTPLFVGNDLNFTKEHIRNFLEDEQVFVDLRCPTNFERHGKTYTVNIKIDGKFPRGYKLYSDVSLDYGNYKEEEKSADMSTIIWSVVGGLAGIGVIGLFGYFFYLYCWRERREENQTNRQSTVTQPVEKTQQSQQNTEQLENAKKTKQLDGYKKRVIALEEQYNKSKQETKRTDV